MKPGYTELQRLRPYLLLLLVAIAGYWPLTTGMFALKNDDIAYFLPYRFNVVENLRNGFLPLWSPYTYLGFPLAGDMQSGAWNPIVWLLALFGRYNHTSLACEMICYIFLAGSGMLKLLKEFGSAARPAFALAVSYMFCGFILDTGQILCWVACAAILPFTYLYLTRILRAPDGRNAALLALSNCMLIAAGYPAFFIINLYIYAFVLIWQAAGRPFSTLRAPLTWLCVSAGLFLLTGALIWCSLYEMLPFYRRGSGLSLKGVLEHSYYSSFSLSTIFPLATSWGRPPFIMPPQIFGNMYFGILLIPFLLRGLWHKRPPVINCIALLSLLCFLLSLGREFPVRTFAFNYLPLMDTFRHPANFRVFVIIGCLLIAARGINEFLKDLPSRKRPVLGIFQLSVVGLVISLVIFLFRSYQLFKLETPVGSALEWKELINRPGFFYQAMFINALAQAAFIVPAWLMLKGGKINVFLLLHVLNMLVIAQPLIVYGWTASGSPEDLNKRINDIPEGFPVSELHLPVSEYRNHEKYDYGMFKNVGSFYARRPLLNGSFTSPTTLTAYYTFLRDTVLVKSLSGYPAINFGDSIVSGKTLIVHTRSGSEQDSTVSPKTLTRSASQQDSTVLEKTPAKFGSEQNISVSVFSPNQISCTITNVSSGLLWVFQNNYPGWSVKVDGRPETIQTVNHCFMGVSMKPGSHEVVFSFRPRWLTAAMIFSVTGFLVCSWLVFRPRNRQTTDLTA